MIPSAELALALGIGIWFTRVAGMRAILSLVLVLYASFTFVGHPPHLFLQISAWMNLTEVGGLFALAVLECMLDNFAALERPLNITMVPVRAVAGAVVFATVIVVQDPFFMRGPMSNWHAMTLPEGLPTLAPWLILGAVIAGIIVVAKVMFRPPASTVPAGVSPTFLSFCEDLVALVVAVVSFLGILLVAFLLFFYRIRNPLYQPG